MFSFNQLPLSASFVAESLIVREKSCAPRANEWKEKVSATEVSFVAAVRGHLLCGLSSPSLGDCCASRSEAGDPREIIAGDEPFEDDIELPVRCLRGARLLLDGQDFSDPVNL